jgi:hypothetical protein
MNQRGTTNREEEVRQHWTRLVGSALDFFAQAVDEHKSLPKYAILHLAASVELFLKARLMAEHWTLIISPKKPLKFDQFKNGDFISVTLDEAVKSIEGVLPSEEHVPIEALLEFKALAKERNKIAHFFHANIEDKSSKVKIIQQQCRVWYHIHFLLTRTWKANFKGFKPRLQKLDSDMRRQKKYLRTIFENLTDELKKLQEDGKLINKCPACDCEALILPNKENYELCQCMVCKYQSHVIRLRCPNTSCQEGIFLENGYGKCLECGHEFTPDEIAMQLQFERPEDDMGHSCCKIYCESCGNPDVYKINTEQYLCLNCMEVHNEVSTCEYCNEYSTGEMENSFLHGCALCDGRLGNLLEKE